MSKIAELEQQQKELAAMKKEISKKLAYERRKEKALQKKREEAEKLELERQEAAAFLAYCRENKMPVGNGDKTIYEYVKILMTAEDAKSSTDGDKQ